MGTTNEKEKLQLEPEHNIEWVEIRERWTKQAIHDGDLASLRKISVLPGGFGGEGMRKKAWSTLLRTHRLNTKIAKKLDMEEKPAKEELVHNDGDGMGSKEDEAGPSELKPHPNERQVKLDTDRSFVTYPRGIPAQSKLELQADLNDLIVGVLRKYPALSYFQGYHDILSVLYLTFIPLKTTPPRSRSSSRNRIRKDKISQLTPEGLSTPRADEKEIEKVKLEDADEKLAETHSVQDEKDVTVVSDIMDEKASRNEPPPTYDTISRQSEDWGELRKCAEMVSLDRVRDAMGSGMEGMMGLLRILKRILKAADPELSKFSSKISPVPTLPFFALSWVLTLFSHDCDNLSPIQRMFDFLLARNPISAVYLAAAILMMKKPQMFEIAHGLGSEYEEDPTLLHPLFVRLPPLYDDTPSEPEPPIPTWTTTPTFDNFEDDSVNPYRAIKLSELFELTDRLMNQFPWDGAIIRGREIMGEGSVVNTYSKTEESNDDERWSPEKMLSMVDVEVVKPGAGDISEEEEEQEEIEKLSEKRRRRLVIRVPRNKVNTILAFGIVILGVGMAVYGFKAGGNHASWNKWWGVVIRSWLGKQSVFRVRDSVAGLTGWIRRTLKDLL